MTVTIAIIIARVHQFIFDECRLRARQTWTGLCAMTQVPPPLFDEHRRPFEKMKIMHLYRRICYLDWRP